MVCSTEPNVVCNASDIFRAVTSPFNESGYRCPNFYIKLRIDEFHLPS